MKARIPGGVDLALSASSALSAKNDSQDDGVCVEADVAAIEFDHLHTTDDEAMQPFKVDGNAFLPSVALIQCHRRQASPNQLDF